MVSFDYAVVKRDSSSLQLEFFIVPWDSGILGRPTAQISMIEVKDPELAPHEFRAFLQWKIKNKIMFCSARIPQANYLESMLLQSFNYRFIELNFRPEINLDLVDYEPDERFRFHYAKREDTPVLEDIATQVFTSGRFHFDQQIGFELANIRYGIWMHNAFELPHQQVVKCIHDGRIAAFFVIEFPSEHHSFWSLVGMAPEYIGRGFGKYVWRSMLHWQRCQGVTRISTSITSLNPAILNVYAQLGFHFPSPDLTLHWHAHPWENE